MFVDDVYPDSRGLLRFSKSLTPAALAAAIGMQEQAFAALGLPSDLRTTDLVLVTPPPGATQANASVVGARVTAAQTITLIFANLTAAANVPTAGVYGFLIIRP